MQQQEELVSSQNHTDLKWTASQLASQQGSAIKSTNRTVKCRRLALPAAKAACMALLPHEQTLWLRQSHECALPTWHAKTCHGLGRPSYKEGPIECKNPSAPACAILAFVKRITRERTGY